MIVRVAEQPQVNHKLSHLRKQDLNKITIKAISTTTETTTTTSRETTTASMDKTKGKSKKNTDFLLSLIRFDFKLGCAK